MTAISTVHPGTTRHAVQFLAAVAAILVVTALAMWLAFRPSAGSSTSPRVVPPAQVDNCQPTLVVHAC